MKVWFTKAKISSALDAGQQPSAWLRRSISGSDELRGFERELTTLDRALKQTVPRLETPPSLHGSIMRAVRAAHHAAPAQRAPSVLRWLPVPASCGAGAAGRLVGGARPLEPAAPGHADPGRSHHGIGPGGPDGAGGAIRSSHPALQRIRAAEPGPEQHRAVPPRQSALMPRFCAGLRNGVHLDASQVVCAELEQGGVVV